MQSSGDVYSGEESFPLLAEESINLNHIENNELLQHMKMTAGYDQQALIMIKDNQSNFQFNSQSTVKSSQIIA